MELEPFWKFDRREQPAIQSFLPPPPSQSFLVFLISPFLPHSSLSLSLSLSLFPFPVSRSFEDSSSKDNFDLIPLDVLFFLPHPPPSIATNLPQQRMAAVLEKQSSLYDFETRYGVVVHWKNLESRIACILGTSRLIEAWNSLFRI